MRYIIILSVLISSCQRLDSSLFNGDNTITEYLLEDFSGEVEFKVPASYNLPADEVTLFTIPSPDIEGDIHLVYLGDMSTIDVDTVIVYCHGNKDHMDFYWHRAKLLANVGEKSRYGVLMMDYRGYGLSDGESSEDGMYADVNASLSWLKGKGLSGDRLIFYGFSLGTAPVVELTANPTILIPSKFILESPFASAEVMVQDGSGLVLPSSFFTNLEIDNAEEIKKINQPFLWLHGVEDNFLDVNTHGQVVFNNYNGTKSFGVRVDNAGHPDLPLIMGFDSYLQTIEFFIQN